MTNRSKGQAFHPLFTKQFDEMYNIAYFVLVVKCLLNTTQNCNLMPTLR